MHKAKNRILCLIPARGGSKRIPQKNSRPLGGIPLISHTIRAARDSRCFTEIVVSTDDPLLMEIAEKEAVAVDKRPTHLCGDTVTKVEVVREFLSRDTVAPEFDFVAALLPTCPFRTAEDIRNAVDMLLSTPEKEFLVGVTEYEFPVQLALNDVGENTVEMVNSENYKNTRSQNNTKLYHPNGAIYLAAIPAFLKKGTFFNEQMLAYRMPATRSFDIDYPYQFELAELMMKRIHEHGKLD